MNGSVHDLAQTDWKGAASQTPLQMTENRERDPLQDAIAWGGAGERGNLEKKKRSKEKEKERPRQEVADTKRVGQRGSSQGEEVQFICSSGDPI